MYLSVDSTASLSLSLSLSFTHTHTQPDMQRAVQYRFMDQSTLVREAAVELLGRSVLSRPELTAQYYNMLSERILVSFTHPHTHTHTVCLSV